MLLLAVFPQDEPPSTTEDASEVSDAIAEWMKGAEQGHASAQFYVGLSYELGRPRPQNYKEAVRWYRAAAEQGHSGAPTWGVAITTEKAYPKTTRKLFDGIGQLRSKEIGMPSSALVSCMTRDGE